MKRIIVFTLLASFVAIAACSDGTGPDPDTGAAVAIKFGTAGATLASAYAGPAMAAAMAASAAQASLITGTNGTLDITDIRVIVEEFELEPVEVSDCDVEPEPAGCKDFEARYFFIDVPLTGVPVTVVRENIPAGLYDELEFEVDDIEVDDDDPEESADASLIAALFTKVRADFPDWPEKASMVVVGSFTPTGGSAVDFRVYFEAEIEVEFDLIPSLEVTEEGVSRSIVIELRPDMWFLQDDGTVMELSEFDFPTTGQLIEFELEIEDGFELEIEA